MLSVPIILGIVGILQGTLNKEIAKDVGLTQATLINTALTFIFSIGLFFIVKYFPKSFPDLFHIKGSLFSFKWWYLFPGILGLIIVSVLPYSLAELGAGRVTILLVGSQMIFGVFWDQMFDGIPIDWRKILGIIFSFIGAYLVTLKS